MKKQSICHPNNPCAGKYGNCLDVILTNACNANCSFCVQRNNEHYIPSPKISVSSMASHIFCNSADNILLVGGEPTLYSELGILLKKITKTKKVYLTTNGSMLSNVRVKMSSLHLLTGMNISIHSPSEKTNNKIFGMDTICFDDIRDAVKAITEKNPACKIRINCNLSKQGVSNFEHVTEMAELARHLGIDVLRVAELQGVSKKDGFIFAKDVFNGFDDEPFTCGCERHVNLEYYKVSVLVRRVCGIVSKNLPPVINPVGRNAQTKVLHPDGVITDGFTGLPDCHKTRKIMDEIVQSNGDCHGSTRGCH